MSQLSMQRWKALQATTPSGRSTFVCINCGRITDAPQDKCPADAYKPSERAKAQAGTAERRFRTEVPCYLYPMTESQYKKLNKEKFLFHGSIISPDGEMRTVNIELEFDTVKEIFAREAEIDFQLAADAAEEVAKDSEFAKMDRAQQKAMALSQQRNVAIGNAAGPALTPNKFPGVASYGPGGLAGGGLAGAVQGGGLQGGYAASIAGFAGSSVQAGQPVGISPAGIKPITDVDKFKTWMAGGRAGKKPKGT